MVIFIESGKTRQRIIIQFEEGKAKYRVKLNTVKTKVSRINNNENLSIAEWEGKIQSDESTDI